MDKGELEGIIKKVTQIPLGYWLDEFLDKEAGFTHEIDMQEVHDRLQEKS